MFRCSLTGPASTGKTTILTQLMPEVHAFAEKKGLQVTFQEERIRTIFEQEYADRYPTFEAVMDSEPLEFQLKASEWFVRDAFSAQDRDSLVISDRFGLDVLVYTYVNLARGFHNPQIEETITANLKKAMLRIDKAFMTRPLARVEKDGFRPACYDGRFRTMEENLFNVLGSTFPNTTWLPSGKDERIDHIMTTIKGVYE